MEYNKIQETYSQEYVNLLTTYILTGLQEQQHTRLSLSKTLATFKNLNYYFFLYCFTM